MLIVGKLFISKQKYLLIHDLLLQRTNNCFSNSCNVYGNIICNLCLVFGNIICNSCHVYGNTFVQVRNSSEVETNMVSVERIKEYQETPQVQILTLIVMMVMIMMSFFPAASSTMMWLLLLKHICFSPPITHTVRKHLLYSRIHKHSLILQDIYIHIVHNLSLFG